MAVIYISSTYEDLKDERQAAALAVRRLGHRAIAMEDYVASDKRPVDKCLEDVRKCGVYIGIFAWRCGFIPDGYKKSITHLEYEAARDAGIPCLIFLLDEKAKWKFDYIAEGEERKKIKALRDELKKKYIVGFFTGPRQLDALVTAAVSDLIGKSGGKPKLGRIVSKMCDRLPQIREFWSFFQEKSEKCPKRPQFYFIHGNELEGHESLLERLMNTCLKEYAESEWGKQYAAIHLEKVAWPKEGNLEEGRKQLPFNLMTQFKQWGEITDFTANTLARLPCFDKRPLVLIKHNIYSSNWDKHTAPLMEWYIRHYWAGLECDDGENIPLFLIFFNVKYQVPKEGGWKKRIFKGKTGNGKYILEHLARLSNSSDKKCPCRMLEELKPLEMVDVLDWFDRYNIYEHELERREKAGVIFSDNNKVVTCKCMAEVEKDLLEIVKEYQREEMK